MKNFDPALDLVLTRTTDVPVELVWKAWTTPELLKQWFTPKPWVTAECELDAQPGGRFYTLMRSPEGQEFPGEGCVLEVTPNERFVWTSAMLPGYRPKVGGGDPMEAGFHFTAVIELTRTAAGTEYRVTLIHPDPEAKNKHEAMGFESGWSSAFDQLVELMRGAM